MTRLGAVLLAAWLALTPGCASAIGTVLTPGEPPYVGTRIDVWLIGRIGEKPLGGVVGALDLPLSALLDTLMLPYTFPVWWRAQARLPGWSKS